MDKSMRDRLLTSEKRLNEIDELLLQPDTASDMNLFKKLNKERSQLDPIVEKFHEYTYAEQNKNDALLMCSDHDPEIAAMGKEELKRNGLWIYGAEIGGDDIYSTNLTGPIGIVIGSEGKGTREIAPPQRTVQIASELGLAHATSREVIRTPRISEFPVTVKIHLTAVLRVNAQ